MTQVKLQVLTFEMENFRNNISVDSLLDLMRNTAQKYSE